MKIIFMGTPDFAVPSLRSIRAAGHDVAIVFTKPDKPKNRGHKLHQSPVKEYALEQGMEVFQPISLKKGGDAEKSLEIIKRLNPDCIVVAAYGQMLPKEILEFPKYGCINVHASLLPRYRGAAPINHCIMNGETESGVSIMHMSEGMDEGDIILTERVGIDGDMNATKLYGILSAAGAGLIIAALDMLEKGTAPRIKQNDAQSCHAPMITKEMCRIDWTRSAKDVYNQIRGLSEVPAAYTFYGGKRLKIYAAELSEAETGAKCTLKAGDIADKSDFTVVCGDGNAVRLLSIQTEGGKRMDVKAFLLGRRLEHSAMESGLHNR